MCSRCHDRPRSGWPSASCSCLRLGQWSVIPARTLSRAARVGPTAHSLRCQPTTQLFSWPGVPPTFGADPLHPVGLPGSAPFWRREHPTTTPAGPPPGPRDGPGRPRPYGGRPRNHPHPNFTRREIDRTIDRTDRVSEPPSRTKVPIAANRELQISGGHSYGSRRIITTTCFSRHGIRAAACNIT